MPKSKVSAFLSVLLVFASGAAMGAVGYRLYVVKTVASFPAPPSKKKMNPEDVRKMILSKLNEAVKLNDEQLAAVQKIYDWQHEQFTQVHKKYQSETDQINKDAEKQRDQIHETSVAKIKAILTPEQQPLYEKWVEVQAAAAAKRRLQQGSGPGGPGPRDGRRPPGPYPAP